MCCSVSRPHCTAAWLSYALLLNQALCCQGDSSPPSLPPPFLPSLHSMQCQQQAPIGQECEDPHCSPGNCSDTARCTLCVSGYHPVNGNCVEDNPGTNCTQRDPNCARCNAGDGCSQCRDSRWAVDRPTGKCRPFPRPGPTNCWRRDRECRYFDSSSRSCRCLACKQHTWTVDRYSGRCRRNTCSERHPNCKACSNSLSTCIVCSSGFQWSSAQRACRPTAPVKRPKTCKQLDRNCKVCKASLPRHCAVCRTGYVRVKGGAAKCRRR